MAHTLKLYKLSKLSSNLFDENFTGRNAHRDMLTPEMNAAILITASRFIDVVKMFAFYSGAQWANTIKHNADQINKEVMDGYDNFLDQWNAQKQKISKGKIIDRYKLVCQIGYKDIMDIKTQLMNVIHGYTHLPKDCPFRVRVSYMEVAILQLADLIASLIGLVDKNMAFSVKQHLSIAVVNSNRRVTIGPASKEQRKKILNRLQESKRFNSGTIMSMSIENIYALSFEGDTRNVCAYAITKLPVHVKAAEAKDIMVTYIETIPGLRWSGLARELLEYLQTTAKDNGYLRMYTVNFQPSNVFWAKCGFEQRVHSFSEPIGFCMLDKMSLTNLLN